MVPLYSTTLSRLHSWTALLVSIFETGKLKPQKQMFFWFFPSVFTRKNISLIMFVPLCFRKIDFYSILDMRNGFNR
jgi:hypothetical protein